MNKRTFSNIQYFVAVGSDNILENSPGFKLNIQHSRLLDQCAGVIIDLSGLLVEPADSSWCDEVGSEVEVGRRK